MRSTVGLLSVLTLSYQNAIHGVQRESNGTLRMNGVILWLKIKHSICPEPC